MSERAKLQRVFHFTPVSQACAALEGGLQGCVTAGETLAVAGVWLSPQVFGPGSLGSSFGAIGLRVSAEFIGRFCVLPVKANPGRPSRKRAVLAKSTSDLPEGVETQLLVDGATESIQEYLLLEDVPPDEIDGFETVRDSRLSDAENAVEHARFFAYLIATRHPLLKCLESPHSTEQTVGGGWWHFAKLRDHLAVGNGATDCDKEALRRLLKRFAEEGEADALQAMSKETCCRLVTEVYSESYSAVTGTEIDLSCD